MQKQNDKEQKKLDQRELDILRGFWGYYEEKRLNTK